MNPTLATTLSGLLVFLLSYLCGSLPSGYIIGRLNGIDIRKYGSHNIGATNVRRVLGRDWSFICFLLDFLKGYLPVVFIGHRFGGTLAVEAAMGGIIAAIGTIMGHVFPVWLHFKGGKGVATSLGALAGIALLPVLIGGLVWLAVFELRRIVSLASMAAVVAIAVSALVLRLLNIYMVSWPGIILLVIVAALVIIRHHENIARLRDGTEKPFPSPKEQTKESPSDKIDTIDKKK